MQQTRSSVRVYTIWRYIQENNLLLYIYTFDFAPCNLSGRLAILTIPAADWGGVGARRQYAKLRSAFIF